MKQLFAVALLALSFSALADSAAPAAPDAWMGARPNVQIAVSHGTTPDTYTINAVVSDLRTGNVLRQTRHGRSRRLTCSRRDRWRRCQGHDLGRVHRHG